MPKHPMTEHEKHFVVHSDHGDFHVAKAGLHPDTVEEFSKHAVKYADKGEVTQEDADDQASKDASDAVAADADADPQPNPYTDEQLATAGLPNAEVGTAKPAPGLGDVKRADSLEEGMPQKPVGLKDELQASGALPTPSKVTKKAENIGRELGTPSLPGQGNGEIGPDGKVINQSNPVSTATLGTDNTSATAQETPAAVVPPVLGKMVAPKLQQITPAERADVASADAARAAQNAAADKAGGMEQAADDERIQAERDLQVTADAKYAEITQRQDALRKDIGDGKIDPDKYWHDRGTAGRISGSIGILLSGFGEGMQRASGHGTSGNIAMQVIQKNIERDIDAQKANLATKQSLLSDTYRETGDLRLATAMTRQHLNNVALAQMNKAASVRGTADVLARNGIATAAAHLSLDQGAREIANQQAVLSVNAKNANTSQDNTLKMAEFKAQADAGAAGKTPREMQGAKISNLNATIGDLDNHLKNLEDATQGPVLGRLAVASPWGGADAKANSAAADILREKLASALGGGVASDARIHQAIASVPDPSDTPAQAKAKIARIKTLLATQRDEYIREQGGVGFKVAPNSNVPLGSQGKPAAPKGD